MWCRAVPELADLLVEPNENRAHGNDAAQTGYRAVLAIRMVPVVVRVHRNIANAVAGFHGISEPRVRFVAHDWPLLSNHARRHRTAVFKRDPERVGDGDSAANNLRLALVDT